MLGFASSAPTYQSRSFMNVPPKPAPSAGPGGGVSESVRGQDDRKRERQARDGVSRPAGGERPVARGFPGSRLTPSRRIVKGPNRGLDGIDYPGPDLARGHSHSIAPLPVPAKREVGNQLTPTETAQTASIDQSRWRNHHTVNGGFGGYSAATDPVPWPNGTGRLRSCSGRSGRRRSPRPGSCRRSADTDAC